MAAHLERDRIEPRHARTPRGEPPAGERALRNALGCFPTGVAVVTALSDDGTPVGLTVNSFSSVSLDPPLILWSLRECSPLVECFARDMPFTVNVLGCGQEPVARQFASACADRFAGVAWHAGPRGLPHIAGAIAHFDCRLRDIHRAGDHRLLIGGVERFAAIEGAPLLFARGAFRTF